MTKSEITKFNSFLSVLDLQDSFRKLYDELHTHTCYRMSSGSKVLGAQGTFFDMKDYDEFLSSVSASEVFIAGFPVDNSALDYWQREVHPLWIEELQKESDAEGKLADDVRPAFREGENLFSIDSGYKFCPSCYQLKKVSEFSANLNNPDGLNCYCRSCSSMKSEKTYTVDLSVHHVVYSQNRIFFSPEFAAEVREKGLVAAVVTKRKGHLFLSFVKKAKNRNLKWYKRNGGLAVSDAAVSKAIVSFFRHTVEDAFYLHISRNTSKKADVVTIEIMKSYSVDDFKNIKFVKRDKLAEQGLITKKEEPRKFSYTAPENDSDRAALFEQMCSDLGIGCNNMIALSCYFLWEHPDHVEDDIETVSLFAGALKRLEWKLQRPVKTVTYESF